MFKHLVIEYANPNDLSDSIVLRFRLRSEQVVHKWVSKVLEAQSKQYNIDDPCRFYGFNDHLTEIDYAITRINQCIDVINSHDRIIERRLERIDDYDTLNYLHHIFEVYHGLLDQQTHEFFLTASKEVRTALATLNLLVHRCEAVARKAPPKHIVTYYGLPKDTTLADEDYSELTDVYSFGTVYLQYAEIGKTLEDLATDCDEYIADEAFKPLRHYTADFVVRFGDSDMTEVQSRRKLYQDYFQTHYEFFNARGLTDITHAYLKPGKIPLANLDVDMDKASVLKLIKTRQYVKSVTFI